MELSKFAHRYEVGAVSEHLDAQKLLGLSTL